jgi:hypothetical protein
MIMGGLRRAEFYIFVFLFGLSGMIVTFGIVVWHLILRLPACGHGARA